MWMLNRKTRYKIIRKLIYAASPEIIEKLVSDSNIEYDKENDNAEIRRKELLDYLDEMHICWNENNIDMTDRQYIEVIDSSNKHKR